MDEPGRELQALVLRLVALEVFEQRVKVLAELFSAISAERAVELLDAAYAAVAAGQARPRVVIDVFHAAVDSGEIPGTLRDAIYTAAANAGAIRVQRIMLAPPPRESEPKRRDAGVPTLGQTLGMRKWMARRVSGDQLDRMLKDIDVSVVANLLKNPHITERDVVRVVAQRPNFSDVIAMVGRSPRWNRSYAVRRAIAFNPYSPVDLTLRQVTFLTRQDLYAVAGDPKLHAEVRQAAAELARRRPPDRRESGVDVDDAIESEAEHFAAAIEGRDDDDGGGGEPER
ncbi:MAG: hypothetical protein JXR83_21550 [Deltaproteobacteria bacterium]|nr:hypothetical protein [Deltaproteobacteria bacterium]